MEEFLSVQIEVDGKKYPARDLKISVESRLEEKNQYLRVNVWTDNEDLNLYAGVALNCIDFRDAAKLAEITDRDWNLGDADNNELGESVFGTPDHETLEIDALNLRLTVQDAEHVFVQMDGFCQYHFGNTNLPVTLHALALLVTQPT